MEIILFILFVVASVVFRILQPRIKGYLGEKSVATILSLLPSDKYKIINDLLIEVDGRTIQIDHLVVSIYGIQCLRCNTVWLHTCPKGLCKLPAKKYKAPAF